MSVSRGDTGASGRRAVHAKRHCIRWQEETRQANMRTSIAAQNAGSQSPLLAVRLVYDNSTCRWDRADMQ